MSYRLEVKESGQRELAELPTRIQRRIVRALEKLAEDPRPSGVHKIRGTEDAYRIRVGDYRVIYEVREKQLVVYVIRMRHRKDAYREF